VGVRRHGSRERLLSRVCGTVPYAAPEVLCAAASLVLLAMLVGGECPFIPIPPPATHVDTSASLVFSI
jgi:hypothetical protein